MYIIRMILKIYILLLINKINLTEESEIVPLSDQIFKSSTVPKDENSKISATVHQNTNKYGLTTWWHNKFANQSELRYFTFKGNEQMDIHPTTDESLSLAISLKTGIYNESHTGVKLEEAHNATIKMITSLAKAHRVNQIGGWGHGWQTAQWAYITGLGAWLLWDDIKDQHDRDYIEKMIVSESDRFINYEVPYYQNIDGHVRYPGDTKAEENGWNSRILQLSTAIMPKHPNHKKWMNKMIELMVSAYSRPSDLNSTVVLNGKMVKDWLNGSNIFDDGTLVNHNLIHPDYMQCIAFLLGTPITYAMAGIATPSAAFHNDVIVYRALNEHQFSSPPYHKPGGTIYVRSSDGKGFTGDVYYPELDDWGTGLRMQFAALDSMMTLFTKHGEKYHSEEWQNQHVKEVLRMQNRFSDGHTFANKSEDKNEMSEEWVAQWSSFNYLTRWVAHNFNITISNQDFSEN